MISNEGSDIYTLKANNLCDKIILPRDDFKKFIWQKIMKLFP